MNHELKILPEYFEPIVEGKKLAELRKNDREFTLGDELLLREFEAGKYTGRQAADAEKRAFTFYWAECLACESKGEERQSHEDAARVFNEIVNIQEENHVRVTQEF